MIATHPRSKFSLLKSKRCFFLAFASIFCWILMVSSASVSGAPVTKSPGKTSNTAKSDDSADLGVIDLTSKSFGSAIGFGEVWLIEFYTPTCSHCVNFAPVYENIARTLHSSNKDGKIRVARVNCSEEKALMTRFGIRAFPSFFLVNGWDVYEFEGNRGATTLTEFAQGGYKKYNVRIFIPINHLRSCMCELSFLRNRLWNLTYHERHPFGNATADSVHELAYGSHGLDARDPDLRRDEGHGIVGVHERKVRDFSNYFGSYNCYVWSDLRNVEHHFADGSIDAK